MVLVLLKAVSPQLQKAHPLKEVSSNHRLSLWLRQTALLKRSSCSEREFSLTSRLHQQLRESANSQRRLCLSLFGLIPIRNHFLPQLLTPL
jgi:hypothetical protein